MFSLGGLYDLRLSEYFFAQPGILISTKGSKEEGVPDRTITLIQEPDII
ncbi:MAG TPA: hypothetical protein VIJ75_05000 [Hanamia sp.]